MSFSVRTDLASELIKPELISRASNYGITVNEETLFGFRVFSVQIHSAAGEKLLGKPRGKYYTLYLDDTVSSSINFFSSVRAVSVLLRRCIHVDYNAPVLIAALGNPDITPDSVGPLSASHILVTNHLKKQDFPDFQLFSSTLLCRTGVLGNSGFESSRHLRALCTDLKPSILIVIDALAGSELDQLCQCVQISDTGISPGSGVGNNREEISQQLFGIPVVAVGVPTIVDASSFSNQKSASNMFVTPRDIDSLVRHISRVIAYGINHALQPHLSFEDMEFLLA